MCWKFRGLSLFVEEDFVQEWFKIFIFLTRNRARRLSVTAQDVGVTGIEDGHGGAAEELTASGTELDL